MNEKLPPPPPPLPTTTTATNLMVEPPQLPLQPIDTEGASMYHITAAQVPLEFGGTLKSSKGSKNNSNQQSPQKKSRRSSSGVGGGVGGGMAGNSSSNTTNQSGSYCTCFGGCGHGNQNRIAMPFWPAVLANLGICALLAGYIFIGSFIFLTIENSNERVVSLDSSFVQHTAQLPQIIQQQQQQRLQQQQHYQHQKHNNLQKQGDNSSAVTASLSAMNTHKRIVRSTNDVGTRHLAKSATTSNSETPEVSTHINRMQVDDKRDSNDAAVVDVSSDVAKQQQQNSIVARSSSSRGSSVLVSAKHSKLNDYDLQALPLADTVVAVNNEAATAVDEDYIGDDASVSSTLSLEDVERRRTVENIWDITVSLNILYKENWTRLAALEIAKFQDQLVKRLVMDLTLSTANGATQSTAAHGSNGGKQRQTTTGFGNYERQRFWQSENMQQQNNQRQHHWWSSNQRINRGHRGRLKSVYFEWNFGTAFLYSMTVITTVGYGTITARSTLGRMVTIGYATLGIPLTLIYLSSIGSVLAKILRYCCNTSAAQRRGVCCCCCLRRPQTTHRTESIGAASNSIFHRHPQVADRKTELKLKHFQQPQQQQPLPYCYVRPPATTAQEMEMQQQQQQQHSRGVTVGRTFDNLSIVTSATEAPRQHATAAAAVLSWSLAGPVGFCVLFLIAYVTFGAVVIALLEDWPLIDGVYFCFMSLSTIGFCDLLPGLNPQPDYNSGSYGSSSQRTSTSTSTSSTASNVAVWFCAVYILSGLTLTSMCVNLLHDEIASRMRVVVKFEKVNDLQQEHRESGYYSGRS